MIHERIVTALAGRETSTHMCTEGETLKQDDLLISLPDKFNIWRHEVSWKVKGNIGLKIG